MDMFTYKTAFKCQNDQTYKPIFSWCKNLPERIEKHDKNQKEGSMEISPYNGLSASAETQTMSFHHILAQDNWSLLKQTH